MPRPLKPIPDPQTGKRTLTIPGIGYHKPTNRYRIRLTVNGQVVSEYFPVSPDGLQAAIRRRDILDAKPLIPMPTNGDIGGDITLVDPDHLDAVDHLDVATTALIVSTDPDVDGDAQQVNPQWLRSVPTGGRGRAIRTALDVVGLAVAGETTTRTIGINAMSVAPTDHPDGERLTVQQVGEIYRDWYAREHCDLDAAVQQADAYNATIADHNAVIRAKRQQRQDANASVAPIPPNSRPYRIVPQQTWLHFVPRKVRNQVRDHLKYFGEFAAFVGPTLTIHRLTADHFRDYYDHCHKVAKSKAKPVVQVSGKKHRKPLTAPDRWVNHRLQAVSGAFRRVHKRYPTAAWVKGLFGQDGMLGILEQKNTATEGRKVLITPAEFHALLDVADVQWRALLMLALNGALKNSDMLIPWTAVDFERGLLIYPRPKNRRMRITPLAAETLDALRQWRAASKSTRPEIFITKDGTPWITTTDSLSKHWDLLRQRVYERTGCKIPATFDSLRKSPSTLIMQRGVKNAREAIQFLLGQMPNASWRYYVGVAPDCLYPAVDLIRETYLKRQTGDRDASGVPSPTDGHSLGANTTDKS